MRTGRITRAMIFILSCTVLWFFLMPANLYGVLGCVVVLTLTSVAAYKGKILMEQEKTGFHIICVLPVAIFCWVAAQKFYERWLPSNVVAKIAQGMGMDSRTLLMISDMLAVVLSLPVLFAAAGWLYRAAEKQKFKTVETKLNKSEEKVAEKQKISGMDLVFFLLLSLCIGMLFALNPWSNDYPGVDSSVFLYIGSQMRNGAVPYSELFDHKGLLLYFIEYLGLCIGNGSFVGVWLLEIVNLFVTALFLFKITQLFSRKKIVCYGAVSIVLCTLNCYMAYEGGNLTEEYALPWIALALYIFVKYFMEGSYRFYEIVLLGISFVAVLMLRVNMVAVWAAFLPVVLIEMLLGKKWKDIGKCIAGFVLGIAAGVLPFVLYGMITGCMEDMLRYYIGFNFGYSDSESSALRLLTTAWFLFRQTAVWMGALLASFWISRKNRIWKLNLWYLVVTLVLASMSGRIYYHYGVILLPAMLVPVILVLEKAAKNIDNGAERYLFGIVLGFLAIQAVVSIASYTGREKSEIAAYIEENTADTDEILVLGNSCRYYLESGRKASDRFFYQTPPINVSEELFDEFMEGFREERPALIIIIGDKENMKNAEPAVAKICEQLEAWESDGTYVYTQKDDYGIFTLMSE